MNNVQAPVASSELPLSRLTLILRRVQASLQGRLGKSPTFADMEEWTGVSERTVKDWFNNTGRPSAQFLLELLDRTSERARHEIIDEACRAWPTLESARLKCDRTVVSKLKTIICQPTGLTIVQGGADESRTFLLNALGNSFLALTERPRRVVGIDVHEPDWFVPVPGVQYLHNLMHPARLREAAQQVWPETVTGRLKLVLLNGVWSVLPELQREMKTLAARCHLIIADAATIRPPSQRGPAAMSVNLIIVSGEPDNILVEIKAV